MVKATATFVGTLEAKNNLSQLIDRAVEGETITITRHGVPVVKLVPVSEQYDVEAAKRGIEEWKRLRASIRKPKGMTIKQMIEEGRQ